MKLERLIADIEEAEDWEMPQIAAEAIAQLHERLKSGKADVAALGKALQLRINADQLEDLAAQLGEIADQLEADAPQE
jgi:hypothetical protein